MCQLAVAVHFVLPVTFNANDLRRQRPGTPAAVHVPAIARLRRRVLHQRRSQRLADVATFDSARLPRTEDPLPGARATRVRERFPRRIGQREVVELLVAVASVLLLDRRTWQLRKSGRPLRRRERPLVGRKAVEQRLRALALERSERVVRVVRPEHHVPASSAIDGDSGTAEVAVRRRRPADCRSASVPSHCSTYTSLPGLKPDPATRTGERLTDRVTRDVQDRARRRWAPGGARVRHHHARIRSRHPRRSAPPLEKTFALGLLPILIARLRVAAIHARGPRRVPGRGGSVPRPLEVRSPPENPGA